jgi:hypothetical protein
MLPHLYWALGGTIGLSLLKPSVLVLPQWEMINWVASVILTAAGLLGIALAYLKTRGILGWSLLGIAWAGCAIATSHGVFGIVYRMMQMAGAIELESGPFNRAEHAYVLWDLLLFEPWFVIEGLLLGILGWHYQNSPRHRQLWLLFCTLGIAAGIVTGLLGLRFA